MDKKYLVIQLARFGDLIQSKRLILSLQQKGQVHLVLDKSLSSLAELVYPEVILHPILAHGQKTSPARILMENRKVLSRLKEIDFDLVVNLNFSGLNFALIRLFDPYRVRGYQNFHGQEVRDKLVRLAFRLAKDRVTAPINLVDYWAFFDDHPISPVNVNPVAGRSGKGLGVVIAGRDPRRSIPLTTLAPIILAMRKRLGQGPIYFLGSQAQQPLAQKLKGLLEPKIISEVKDLTGKTSWTDLVQLVQSLEAVVTPDTGTMHLAAHLGVPVWAFFFSSAWCFETGPYGQGHVVLQAMPHCAPCVESRPCHFDLICHEKLAHKSIIQFILDNKKDEQDELCVLTSDFDEVGVVYRPVFGHDLYVSSRLRLRHALRLFLNPGMGSQHFVSSDLIQGMFPEREWMLP
jgi:ADP-heptose:LPS heptosyltransferase